MPPGMAIRASELYLQLTITSVLCFISLQNDSSYMQKSKIDSLVRFNISCQREL